MLADLLVDVTELLEVELSAYEPERVSVWFGRPSHPTGECGPHVWVWGTTIYHSNLPNERTGPEATCFYRRTYEMRYRIDVCYPIAANDLTDTVALETAEKLYGLADDAWCAITAAASSGTLFATIGDCDDITVGELVIAEPQGGIVSAEGTIQVSNPCGGS